MNDATQISALVSRATKELLERHVRATGVKKVRRPAASDHDVPLDARHRRRRRMTPEVVRSRHRFASAPSAPCNERVDAGRIVCPELLNNAKSDRWRQAQRLYKNRIDTVGVKP